MRPWGASWRRRTGQKLVATGAAASLRAMRCVWCGVATLGLAAWASAAEQKFEFGETPPDQPPAGFRSLLTGQGQPGEWKVILDDLPTALPPLTPEAPKTNRRPVLAQLSRDPTDERFPVLVFESEVFGDFTFTTRFKTVAGDQERMAGIAFRLQDEQNYYVVRASSLGNSFKFYKFVAGQRTVPIGPEIEIPSGVWHELAVECRGNQIRCWLNGKEVIPPLTDNSFAFGKIGFWTKSDSVSHFADARITYTPREPLAKVALRAALEKYPRLLGLTLYAPVGPEKTLQVVAASDEQKLGRTGGAVEADVIARGVTYFGREKTRLLVTLPLHDRNGEPVAALRVALKPFLGQTEQNAVVRALPIAKEIEGRFRTLQELVE